MIGVAFHRVLSCSAKWFSILNLVGGVHAFSQLIGLMGCTKQQGIMGGLSSAVYAGAVRPNCCGYSVGPPTWVEGTTFFQGLDQGAVELFGLPVASWVVSGSEGVQRVNVVQHCGEQFVVGMGTLNGEDALGWAKQGEYFFLQEPSYRCSVCFLCSSSNRPFGKIFRSDKDVLLPVLRDWEGAHKVEPSLDKYGVGYNWVERLL